MKPYTKAHATHKISGVLTLPVLPIKKASSGYKVIAVTSILHRREQSFRKIMAEIPLTRNAGAQKHCKAASLA